MYGQATLIVCTTHLHTMKSYLKKKKGGGGGGGGGGGEGEREREGGGGGGEHLVEMSCMCDQGPLLIIFIPIMVACLGFQASVFNTSSPVIAMGGSYGGKLHATRAM